MTDRTEILYGGACCKKLRNARVVLCGAGAVGSFAAEALARLGVGYFEIFDFDCFEKSNVNRQLCALESTVGRRKVEVQKGRILDINPAAQVVVHDTLIDASVAAEIAAQSPSVVVDAIDDISAKVALARSCAESGVPLVSSMGAARRKNPLEVKTADVFKTYGCPFAASIRKRLRAEGIRRGYMCVFSPERVEESTHVSASAAGRKKVIGSSVIVTGVFGLNLANLALEEIIKNG